MKQPTTAITRERNNRAASARRFSIWIPYCVALFAGVLLAAPAQAEWRLSVTNIEVDGVSVKQAQIEIDRKHKTVAIDDGFAAGTEIAVPARTVLQVRSSNDNRQRLLPGTRLRIAAGSNRGEEYALEDGESFFDVRRALDFFNVRHRSFQAIVKGTRYSVKVEPGKDIRFAVEVGRIRIEREGKIRIEEGDKDGTITEIEYLKAGEEKTYRLDMDQYLKKFQHFGEAEAYYRTNLDRDRQSGDRERIQAGVWQMASALLTLGKARDALPYLDEQLEITHELHPDGQHPDIASSLGNLGNAYQTLGGADNLKRAIDYYKRNLDIRHQIHPDGQHPDIASSLGNLGNAYRTLGGADNLKRAIDYFKESLKLWRQLYPDGRHPEIARSLGNLGGAFLALRTDKINLAMAIVLYEESLKLTRQHYPDGRHPDIAIILSNLGNAYQTLGGADNLERAIDYYEQSLKLRRQLYPDGRHPGTAMTLNNLGAAYSTAHMSSADNIKRAIDYYEQSLKLMRQFYPDGQHPDIAMTLNNLGAAYGDLGGADNLKRAIDYYEQSLKLRRQLYPDDQHPDIAKTLNNLGGAYGDLGGADNLKRAIDYFKESLKLRRQLYPDGRHPDIAISLGSLASHHLFAGQYEAALRDAREAFSIATKHTWIRTNEAHALLLLDRETEAMEIYQRLADEPVNARQRFRDAVLDDFAALRKAGVDHPGFAKVEALYQVGR